MKLNKTHWIGIIFGLVIIISDFAFFWKDKIFFFLLGIAFVICALPFVLGAVGETNKEQEINSMFLEFSRNLSESVNAGTPISKSIINVGKKNYGALSPSVNKLANQIQLGIPVQTALKIFAEDTNNPVIGRAVGLIQQAERAGGQIDFILESVAKSISEVEKLKKERKASISNLVVQGYIIFFIFIGITLVMEYKILPLTAGIGSLGSFSSASGFGAISEAPSAMAVKPEELARPFLYLLLVQGLFAGLVIGKLAEGRIKAGIKHSFFLVAASFLISTGVRAFIS